MGTYGENIDLSRGWPQYNYGRYYRGSVEQELRNEIATLRNRVAELEARQPAPYEVRLFINDKWVNTYKASDKIRVVEHKYLRTDDRTLFARH